MNKLHNGYGEWLTVKQVSHMTGKSIDAIRMLLHRKKLSNVKKVNNHNGGPNREHWLIHRDTAALLCNSHMTDNRSDVMVNSDITETAEQLHNIDVIPLHYHDLKQREWLTERDQLQAGLLMYRYKFEELDRQVRLLPAPVETVGTLLQDREAKVAELEHKEQELRDSRQALDRSQEAVSALEEALQRERSRSWWQRLWGGR